MKLYDFGARFDYAFLAIAARLPRPFALGCCAVRALLRFCLNLEWRGYALSQGYVRQATNKCYRGLQEKPDTVFAWVRRMFWVLGRFWVESIEEFDVVRLDRKGLSAGRFYLTSRGIRTDLHAGMENKVYAQFGSVEKQGLVLLTAHLESLYLPLCHLAACGRPVYLAATQIIENPQVPEPIRAHYQLKKRVLERYLGSDHVVYVEHGMSRLVRALKEGSIVVIACDSPSPPNSRGIEVSFLGKRVLMAEGPRWLASITKARLALMTVRRFGFWRYDLNVSYFHEEQASTSCSTTAYLDASFELAYKELGDVISDAPWRWWAADLATQYRHPS